MMAQVVILAQADIIDGQLHEAGEYVIVPDNYTNVRRVVRKNYRPDVANQARFDRVALGKVIERLARHPAWEHLPEPRRAMIIEKIQKNPGGLRGVLKRLDGAVEDELGPPGVQGKKV